MTLLLVLSLLVQADDRRAERERMELLRRIAPAMASLAPPAKAQTLPALESYVKPLVAEPTQAYSLFSAARPAVTWTHDAISTPAPDDGADAAMPGFFIDEKGTFVTTTDALERARFRGQIHLADGRTLEAKVVSREPKLGLAVLKVETSEPTRPLKLGDSKAVEAGRTAVIAGIAGRSVVLRHAAVIGREREALNLYSVEDFLHLDYPALPHETGAAVLTLDGEVIGVLAEAVFEGGRWPRRAYAIPSATLSAFLAKRDAQGNFPAGVLGLEFAPGENRVVAVTPGGAAEKAGVQAGDAVTQIDGRPVRDSIDVTRVSRFKAGEAVELTVRRKDATIKIPVTVGTYEGPRPDATPEEAASRIVGIEVVDLSDDLRKFLGLDVARGVVVKSVSSGGAAEQAGLRKGDVITALDNRAVEGSADFVERVRKLDKETFVVLETYRDGKRVPVVIKVRGNR